MVDDAARQGGEHGPVAVSADSGDHGIGPVQEVRAAVRDGVRPEGGIQEAVDIHLPEQERHERPGTALLGQPGATGLQVMQAGELGQAGHRGQEEGHQLALLASRAASWVLHAGAAQVLLQAHNESSHRG